MQPCQVASIKWCNHHPQMGGKTEASAIRLSHILPSLSPFFHFLLGDRSNHDVFNLKTKLLKIGLQSRVQNGLEFTGILLPQLPEFWDWRHESLLLAAPLLFQHCVVPAAADALNSLFTSLGVSRVCPTLLVAFSFTSCSHSPEHTAAIFPS